MSTTRTVSARRAMHPSSAVCSRQVNEAPLDASDRPDELLWRLWAAKEAAFKVVSKIRGAPPLFVHPAFRVDPVDTFSREGVVRCAGKI